MKITLETQLIAAAFKIVNKPSKQSRFCTDGVHISNTEAGNAMIVGTDQSGMILLRSDFVAPEFDFTIPHDICEKIKYKRNSPVTVEIEVDKYNPDNAESGNISVKYGGTLFTGKVNEVNGPYPRFKSIYDGYKGDEFKPSHFDALVLKKFYDIGKIFGVENRCVTHHNNGDSVSRVVFLKDVKSDDALDYAIGYIMPISMYKSGEPVSYNVIQF